MDIDKNTVRIEFYKGSGPNDTLTTDDIRKIVEALQDEHVQYYKAALEFRREDILDRMHRPYSEETINNMVAALRSIGVNVTRKDQKK